MDACGNMVTDAIYRRTETSWLGMYMSLVYVDDAQLSHECMSQQTHCIISKRWLRYNHDGREAVSFFFLLKYFNNSLHISQSMIFLNFSSFADTD